MTDGMSSEMKALVAIATEAADALNGYAGRCAEISRMENANGAVRDTAKMLADEFSRESARLSLALVYQGAHRWPASSRAGAWAIPSSRRS